MDDAWENQELKAGEMGYLMSACRVTLKDRWPNEREWKKGGSEAEVTESTERNVLRWFGHRESMASSRVIKKNYTKVTWWELGYLEDREWDGEDEFQEHLAERELAGKRRWWGWQSTGGSFLQSPKGNLDIGVGYRLTGKGALWLKNTASTGKCHSLQCRSVQNLSLT